ncbi:MAG: hypothetical protein KHX31_04655 [Akkermansia sp.]|uniref:hypothetical protein n=1 Tax=Akkermansia sp. TaxID=1872421 RepID=UPI0025C25AAF|nr:hypothetical protein [Akkermansia sp.]MBS5507907.1 hypothetical protein [Akkermansia sp.]
MTSTPLRQFFPTLGVVLLLGFFLYSMTAATPGAQEADRPAPAAQAADVPTVITIRCAHRPESLSVSCGGRILWQSGTPGLHEEVECGLPLEDGSVTLTVSARWPEGTPDTPVTLELEPEGRPSASATRWSFGPSLNDSYSFSWK